MKFGKPLYIPDQKIYKSELADGFRCESVCENTTLTPPPETFLGSLKEGLIQALILNTKGWFSKPLTEAWLLQKVQLSFPNETLPTDFEGTLVWQAKTLVISKELFVFQLELVEKRETPKVVIEFPEEPKPFMKKEKQVLTREELKAKVMIERQRAAKALFRAERLTQEYYELYGDETDWEESDSSDSEDE
jgi:hypothetical protein